MADHAFSSAPPVCQQWFSTRRLSDRLYHISEPHYWEWNRANLWLIKGRERDLLFDTGLGVASLRSHLAALIDKPLLAVASHVHFDHCGGMHEFDERAIHAAEASALRTGDAIEMLCDPSQGWVLPEHFAELPYAGFTVREYRVQGAEPTRILNEGDVIDLGDRALEVMHLPGHSPGCIALWDARAQELYSGDVIYDGELLDALPGSHVPTYMASFERLKRLPIRIVYPGHYAIFDGRRCTQIIQEYLESRRRPGCPAERLSATSPN